MFKIYVFLGTNHHRYYNASALRSHREAPSQLSYTNKSNTQWMSSDIDRYHKRKSVFQGKSLKTVLDCNLINNINKAKDFDNRRGMVDFEIGILGGGMTEAPSRRKSVRGPTRTLAQ